MKQSETDTRYLKTREWAIAFLYIALVASLTLITQILIPARRPELVEVAVPAQKIITVCIEGAVENPGVYQLKKGSKIATLLRLARPNEDADLRDIRPGVVLKDGRRVRVPGCSYVVVRVEGEVEKVVTLRVPKGTVVKEIYNQVGLKPESDPSPLLKKRQLKDGEIIVVMKKKRRGRKVL